MSLEKDIFTKQTNTKVHLNLIQKMKKIRNSRQIIKRISKTKKYLQIQATPHIKLKIMEI